MGHLEVVDKVVPTGAAHRNVAFLHRPCIVHILHRNIVVGNGKNVVAVYVHAAVYAYKLVARYAPFLFYVAARREFANNVGTAVGKID